MSALTFALIATHAGAVYIVDSSLSESDCRALSQPGAITHFEITAGEYLIPDSTTQFACNVELAPPRDPHIPGDGAGAFKLSGDNGVKQFRYGQPIEFWNRKAEQWHHATPRKRASKHGGKTTRGRPRD